MSDDIPYLLGFSTDLARKNEQKGLGFSKREDQATIVEEDAIDVPNQVIFLAIVVRINGGLMIIGVDSIVVGVSCVSVFRSHCNVRYLSYKHEFNAPNRPVIDATYV